jgi:hypothetical protein
MVSFRPVVASGVAPFVHRTKEPLLVVDRVRVARGSIVADDEFGGVVGKITGAPRDAVNRSVW